MLKYFKNSLFICSLIVITLTALNTYSLEYGEEFAKAPSNVTKSVYFSDLSADDWCYKYISDMVTRKIISGYPDGKFRPNNTISRAEFAKILVSASGTKIINISNNTNLTFQDVKPEDWYFPFVESVKPFLTGYKETNNTLHFRPNQCVLREDVAVALVKIKGYDTRIEDESILEAMFIDVDSISETAKKYVAIAIENKIISGYPDDTFRAQGFLTRGEACAMIWKAMQFGTDSKIVLQ